MTAADILKSALSFMGAKPEDNDVEESFAVTWLNMSLQESLSCENSIREARELERYVTAPFIEKLNDEVSFSEELCRVSLPYALCSYICMSEDEAFNSTEFRNKFIMSLNDFSKINFDLG